MVKAGDRYWARTNTTIDGQQEGHYFFVLLDPCGPDYITLIVPYCTKRVGFHDPTCILRAGNPPFLTSDSYVDYRYADTKSAHDIDKEIADGRARVSETISAPLLQTVCHGILASPFTKRRIKLWYQEFLLDTL